MFLTQITLRLHVVARRKWGHGADRLVLGRAGGQVRVDLARALAPPHEARGEAPVVAPPARAPGRLLVAVSAV